LGLNRLSWLRENYGIATFPSPSFSTDYVRQYHILIRFTVWFCAPIIVQYRHGMLFS